MLTFPFTFFKSSAGASFLLDDFPGAEIAISIRKLSSTYSGACCNVRGVTGGKANYQVDVDFDFDSNGELSMDSLCTTAGPFLGNTLATYADTDTVVGVKIAYDQSGGGNNLTAGADSLLPTIVSMGTLQTEGGKSVFSFDGTDQLITSSNPMQGDSIVSHFSVKTIPLAENQWMFANGSSTSYYMIGQFASGGAAPDGKVGTPDYYKNGVFLGTGGAGHTIDRDDINDEYSTGAQVLATVLELNWSTYSANWGNYEMWDFGGFNTLGDLQELVLYPNDQTANRTGIEDNINTFYGIY